MFVVTLLLLCLLSGFSIRWQRSNPSKSESYSLGQQWNAVPCTGGTINSPSPPGCYWQECTSYNQNLPCICTGDSKKDRQDCICSSNSDSNEVGSCTCGNSSQHPTGCLCQGTNDHDCLCNFILGNDPVGCLGYCGTGQFPENYDCLCMSTDQICKAGPQPCSSGSLDQPSPPGCYWEQCYSSSQGLPCVCTGQQGKDRSDCVCSSNSDIQTGQCVCGNYTQHPIGCTCSGPKDHDCLCNYLGNKDPFECVGYCGFLQYPSQNQCLCHPDDQQCIAGPQPCKGGTIYEPTPQYCQYEECTSSSQDWPCLCTGNNQYDTSDCICPYKDNESVPVGSCVCGRDVYHPSGCTCFGEYDHNCYCNSREDDNPWECQRYCETGYFPDRDLCLCRDNDNICKAGRKQCTGGTMQQPEPAGCYPVQCTSSGQKYPCLCTYDTKKDIPNCVCPSRDPIEPGACVCGMESYQHPEGCICSHKSDAWCVCSKTSVDPEKCGHICGSGEFPDYDNCFCSLKDSTCLNQRQPCKGGTLNNPTPLGCYPDNCQSKTQSYPCVCTGNSNVDRPDCICSDPDYTRVPSGSCVCNRFNHHPTGCVCVNSTDHDCVCNSK
ncbi:MAG: hypothetical protein EZS28_039338, partial [Streblomastix strix]